MGRFVGCCSFVLMERQSNKGRKQEANEEENRGG